MITRKSSQLPLKLNAMRLKNPNHPTTPPADHPARRRQWARHQAIKATEAAAAVAVAAATTDSGCSFCVAGAPSEPLFASATALAHAASKIANPKMLTKTTSIGRRCKQRRSFSGLQTVTQPSRRRSTRDKGSNLRLRLFSNLL